MHMVHLAEMGDANQGNHAVLRQAGVYMQHVCMTCTLQL